MPPDLLLVAGCPVQPSAQILTPADKDLLIHLFKTSYSFLSILAAATGAQAPIIAAASPLVSYGDTTFHSAVPRELYKVDTRLAAPQWFPPSPLG